MEQNIEELRQTILQQQREIQRLQEENRKLLNSSNNRNQSDILGVTRMDDRFNSAPIIYNNEHLEKQAYNTGNSNIRHIVPNSISNGFRMSLLAPPPPLVSNDNNVVSETANNSLIVDSAIKSLDEAEKRLHSLSILSGSSVSNGSAGQRTPVITNSALGLDQENRVVTERIRFLMQDLDSIHVEIPSTYLIVDPARKREIAYNINVRSINHATGTPTTLWRVQKVYQDFVELSELLPRDLSYNGSFKLPSDLLPKTLFSPNTPVAPAKSDGRRETVKLYISNLLSEIIAMKRNQIESPTNSPHSALLKGILGFLSTNTVDPQTTKLFQSIKEGHLTKKGRKFGKWKRRYFVLMPDQLVYWESKEDALNCARSMRNLKMTFVNGSNSVWHPTLGPHGIIPLLGSKISKQKSQLSNIEVSEAVKNNNSNMFESEQMKSNQPVSEYRHAFMISNMAIPRHLIRDLAESEIRRNILCAESDIERDEWVYFLVKQIEKLKRMEPGPSEVQMLPHTPSNPDKREGNASPLPPLLLAPTERVQEVTAKKDIELERKDITKQAITTTAVKKAKNFRNSINAAISGKGKAENNDSSEEPDDILDETKVFGASLNKAVELSKPTQGMEAPSIVVRCIEYLEYKNAIGEEGIYRINGNQSFINKLMAEFDKEHDIDLVANDKQEHNSDTGAMIQYDVHDIAGLLKKYLRLLPESIFTASKHREFLGVMEWNEDTRIQELARLVGQLPIENYTVLRLLITHFVRIADNSAVNKMNVRNIGIVFAPTLGVPVAVLTLLMADLETIFWLKAEVEQVDQSTNDSSETGSTQVVLAGKRNSSIFKQNLPPSLIEYEAATTMKQLQHIAIVEESEEEDCIAFDAEEEDD